MGNRNLVTNSFSRCKLRGLLSFGGHRRHDILSIMNKYVSSINTVCKPSLSSREVYYIVVPTNNIEIKYLSMLHNIHNTPEYKTQDQSSKSNPSLATEGDIQVNGISKQ